MEVIENDWLKVTVQPLGAELTGLFNKQTRLEYIWAADPKFWAKHSPVLFPIVGALKNNSYLFKGRSYQLNRHGFAREQLFRVDQRSTGAVTFLLQHSDATLAVYPFAFSLRIRYLLDTNRLQVQYEVINEGEGAMYFSIGAHPAFRVPLSPGTRYADYFLEFEKSEQSPRWIITPEGLISRESTPFLENTRILPLAKSLFYRDAIVFKNLQSQSIQLRSNITQHGISMQFPGFPYFGIWAAKDADFVCLEPWCGIADAEYTNQELIVKEGIETLQQGETFARTWSVQCY